MVIAFPQEVRARLDRIEREEGVPVLDLVHQAVDLYSRLDADGRRILGIAAMRLVVDQIQRRSR